MKTHVRKCGLWAAVLFATALVASAQNVPVTFNVDMSAQSAIGWGVAGVNGYPWIRAFDPSRGDTVMVSGNWDGWNAPTSQTMSPTVGNTNIWTFTTNLAVGSWPNYNFIENPYGDSSDGGLHWENRSARWFQVPSGGTNLPAVYFSDASGTVASNNVTFYVNMSIQIQEGNFNPATDYIYVAGDWNWATEGMPAMTAQAAPADTNVYYLTIQLGNFVGATENYKFYFVPLVGSTTWEGLGGNNRQFSFPSSDTNLPVVYFNNQSCVLCLTNVPVTFQVDMSVWDSYGLFTPGVDTVTVSGDTSLNNWSATDWPLTATSTNADLYVGTYYATNIPGTSVQYKFVLDGGATWENNYVGPGLTQNRLFTMPTSATNLPLVYWDNTNNLGTLSISKSAGQAVLSWVPGPRVKLESESGFGSGWQGVTNTLGSNSASVSLTGTKYFRLIGPTNN
jgi:hypothetical protein